MVNYLKSVNTNPDKVIKFYSGRSSEGAPAVWVWDKFTDEMWMWWGEMTHERFRTMLTIIRTDYRTLSDTLTR